MSSFVDIELPEGVPVVVTDDGPRLVGGRCVACGATLFPWRSFCSSCAEGRVERSLLPAEGTLWTWTIQGFPPKPPYRVRPDGAAFEPYGVGYVEFPGALRIEGVLTISDPDALRIGRPMRVVADESGTWFAFGPAERDDRATASPEVAV